jgi:hypothetical protein
MVNEVLYRKLAASVVDLDSFNPEPDTDPDPQHNLQHILLVLKVLEMKFNFS